SWNRSSGCPASEACCSRRLTTGTCRSSRASCWSSPPSSSWPTSAPTCSTTCSTQGSAMAVPVAHALPPVLPPGDMPAPGRLSPARRLMRSLEVAIPAAVLALLLFFCFIWPLVYPVPKPVGGSILDSGLPLWSPGHIFGTDTVGNDIMSRILYGGRVSFEVAAAVQVIGLAVGGLLGLIAGYRGGTLEAVLMRVLDVFIAFPSLVLVLAIVDSLGQSELNVIWALSAFSIPAFARVTRAATLRLRDQPFIVAAR